MPVERSPRVAEARRLFDAGKLLASFAILDEVLASSEGDVEALVLAGIIAARTHRPAEATERLEKALALDPNHYDALIWLANVRQIEKEFEPAIALLRRAAAIRQDDPPVLGLLGTCCLSLGQPKEAAEWFRKVIGLAPEAAQGHFNLGLALRMQNRGEEALDAFLLALKYEPERPENYLQVFKQMQHLSRWEEAIGVLAEGRRRHPNSTILTEALGVAFARLNQSDQAEEVFREVAESDSSTALAYAKWLQEQGRFEDSSGLLISCIDRDPLLGAAYNELAAAKVFKVHDERLLDKALTVYSSVGNDERNRMHLAYAIAAAYEFDGHYPEAMRYYDVANDLAYKLYPSCKTFEAAKALEDPEIMSSIYTVEVLQEMRQYGSTSKKPIFITGMIRSGTTLLDQIVSSHPMVSSAGEQQFWNAETERIHRKWRTAPSKEDLPLLSNRYLEVISEGAPSAEFITDKMPLNFRHLGLISCAFPNAKLLHIRRAPLDTALSIYTTFFAGGPNFAYNKANIVAFYRGYQKMMDYWRSALSPAQFLELDYEDLILAPAETVRGLIGFLELPWDDACLRFYENSSNVATPSRWQVRQPIYSSSMGRSRHFRPWLGELLELE